MDFLNEMDILTKLCVKSEKSKLFDMPCWITLNEAKILMTLIHGSEIYFECGTAYGFSSVVASLVIDTVHTYDPVDRPKIWDHFKIRTKKNINYHIQRFDEADFKSASGKKKAVFIDGKHSPHAVRRDWEAVKPWLEEGDIVVFHDLAIAAVLEEFIKILRETYYAYKVFPSERILGVIRI